MAAAAKPEASSGNAPVSGTGHKEAWATPCKDNTLEQSKSCHWCIDAAQFQDIRAAFQTELKEQRQAFLNELRVTTNREHLVDSKATRISLLDHVSD